MNGKGVSPILASVLVVLVAISLSGAFLVFTQSTTNQLTESSQESQERLQAELDTRPVIEGVSNSQVFLRNAGETVIDDGSVQIFLNDIRMDYVLSSPIAPGEIGSLNITEPWRAGSGHKTFRVTGGALTDSVTVNVGPTDYVLYLPFDEGEGVSTGHPTSTFSGTLGTGSCTPGNGNCPSWATGIAGEALSFDCDDDYVNVGNHRPALSGEGPEGLTISFWAKREGTSTLSGPRLVSTDCSDYYCFNLNSAGDGQLSFITQSVSGAGSVLNHGPGLPLDTWVHVVGTYDPGTGTKHLYIDRERVGTHNLSPEELGQEKQDDGLALGTNVEISPQGDNVFNGVIDEMKMYRRVYTASEMYAVNSA